MTDGPRLAVNQFMVAGMPFGDLVAWCAREGVAGIGLLRGSVRELGPERTAEILRRHGVVGTSLCVALGLVHPDPDGRAALYADALRALRDATDLRVPLVVVVGGPNRRLRLDAAREQARDQVLRLAEHAGRLGTRLLLEPLHPVMAYLSAHTTLDEAGSVAAKAGDVGLVLDTWHTWTDPDLDAAIGRHADRIEIAHLSDWSASPTGDRDRELPGLGLIDLPALCRRLRGAGFVGWWEIEVLTGAYPPADLLDRALSATRSMLAETRVDPCVS